MKNLFKAFLEAPKGIRYKMTIAFALMSVIPMLVFGYLVIQYLFPRLSRFGDISVLFLFTVLLMVAGFYLAKMIILPVIKINAHAKDIVEGELDSQLEISRGDEIGELGISLNRLSVKLKKNMGDLRDYGEKIEKINMEINKKVLALSSILQINNLLTIDFKVDEVLSAIVEKLSDLQEKSPVFLMLFKRGGLELFIKSSANLRMDNPQALRYNPGRGFLSQIFNSGLPLIIDAQREKEADDDDLAQLLPVKNKVILPVTSSGKVIAILGVGNNVPGFVFSDEEMELITVFAKQVTMTIESDQLQRKAEELAITDEATGLYNEKYIRGRLDEEIKRAVSYQRPCSFMILEMVNFEHYQDALGEEMTEKTLKKVAQTFQESISEIDKVARFSDNQFAVIFPEKNKRQSLEVAENINKEIVRFAQSQKGLGYAATLKISAGISSTPLDGTTSIELINKALLYTEKAKESGNNQIAIS